MDRYSLLVRHEGKRNKMYLDQKGIETIGIGHNLRAVPISDRAVKVIFEDDTAGLDAELQTLPWYIALSEARQAAIFDLAFNVGFHGLLLFTHMISAIAEKDFSRAADEIESSHLEPQRRHDLATMMREDRWLES